MSKWAKSEHELTLTSEQDIIVHAQKDSPRKPASLPKGPILLLISSNKDNPASKWCSIGNDMVSLMSFASCYDFIYEPFASVFDRMSTWSGLTRKLISRENLFVWSISCLHSKGLLGVAAEASNEQQVHALSPKSHCHQRQRQRQRGVVMARETGSMLQKKNIKY